MASEASERFEDLYAKLEGYARRLEQGNLPLEESLELYEEGAALVDRLRGMLQAAELRLQTINQRLEREESGLQELEMEVDLDEAGFEAGE
ncbi:exodeoxyribonuclease VII small subunit [Tepidiforma sp.]|uniref:exodeoxyribonuclease VII small subunit n=1 Tax=Tepidiforma sp. TaxID=2682230 RepID=UPI002ADE7608|nr:exodeoxyribonuclease VII small subunit [Tepidiforma sp.]